MKRLIVLIMAGFALSCNNSATTPTAAAKDTTSATATAPATKVDYPYSIEHPDNWEVGSTANTTIALNSLKAWEDGKMDESLSYFGDTVVLQFDGPDKKLAKDSLKLMLTAGRNHYKTVEERLTDWESVVSKDKSEEWVTVWYTQSWETVKGEKDSASIINDMQIKGGKIVKLAEYTRKLH